MTNHVKIGAVGTTTVRVHDTISTERGRSVAFEPWIPSWYGAFQHHPWQQTGTTIEPIKRFSAWHNMSFVRYSVLHKLRNHFEKFRITSHDGWRRPVQNTPALVRKKQAQGRTRRHRTPQNRSAKLETTPHDTNSYGSIDVRPQGTSHPPDELTVVKGPCATDHSFVSIKTNPLTNGKGIWHIRFTLISLNTILSFREIESGNLPPNLDQSTRADDEETGDEAHNSTRLDAHFCHPSPPMSNLMHPRSDRVMLTPRSRRFTKTSHPHLSWSPCWCSRRGVGWIRSRRWRSPDQGRGRGHTRLQPRPTGWEPYRCRSLAWGHVDSPHRPPFK